MPTEAENKKALANIALGHLGTVSLADWSEVTGGTSPEGVHVGRQWDLVRDALLRQRHWNFAVKRAMLTLAGGVNLPGLAPVTGGTRLKVASVAGLSAGMALRASFAAPGTTITEIGAMADGDGLWTITLSLPMTTTAIAQVATAFFAPAFDYLYAYDLPADYLRALEWNGREAGTGGAGFEIEGGRLVCNDEAAQLRYVAAVTDPGLWDSSFRQAFALKLAARIAPGITTATGLAAGLDQQAEAYVLRAFGPDNNETQPRVALAQSGGGWLNAREGAWGPGWGGEAGGRGGQRPADVSGKLDVSALDTSGTLAGNSDSRVATQRAVKTYVDAGLAGKVSTSVQVNGHALTGNVAVNAADVGLGSVTNDAQLKAAQMDTDTALAANSDSRVPSQKAVKGYVDTGLSGKVSTTVQVNGHALTGNVTVNAADVGLGSVTNDAQLKAAQLDTDAALAANSDTRVASQKAVRTFVSNLVAGLLKLQGNKDASANPNYPAGTLGDAYYISVAGRMGGASGKVVEVGDLLVCKTTGAAGDEAAAGASWFVLQSNISGITSFGLLLMQAAGASSVKALLSLGNVQDIQLTTWGGSTSLTQLGTVTGGVWNSTALTDAYVASAPTWNGYGRHLTLQTLTDGTSISWNLLNGAYAKVTLAGNRTLALPTNAASGMSGMLKVKQDTTGGRTLAYASGWKFPGGTVPSLSTAANAVDILSWFTDDGAVFNATLQKAFS